MNYIKNDTVPIPAADTSDQPDIDPQAMPDASDQPEIATQPEIAPQPTPDTSVQPDETAALASVDEEPVVLIRGLVKSFKDHEVLRGVDLHVKKGENLVILGKSGTGKSVLIKCLVGLEWPDAGTISIFGEDIAALSYNKMNALRVR
ncbi:MAG TPA: ATP-binding cassette domain-containing protein, partial [Puia sp.]|nr:ATP-binding cassette domain-containing protein [Puia sp.]